MTWAKVDTLVRSHRKIQKAIRAVGNANAVWLWHCGNLYCRDVLSDGFIDDEIVSTLAPGLAEKAIAPLPDVLISVGLWVRVEGGYRIHDFLDHNPTKDEVEGKREKDRARKRVGIHLDSARNRHGVQSDSNAHAHAGVGARTSASLSGSLEVSGSLEGGSGETAPMPAGREGVRDRYRSIHGPTPLEWERQHGKHALRADLCDWVCLPESVFAEWVNRLTAAGATRDTATVDIRAWALDVRARWAGRVPGDDNFAFWRNEWQATHGTNRPSSTPRPGAGLDALIGGPRG